MPGGVIKSNRGRRRQRKALGREVRHTETGKELRVVVRISTAVGRYEKQQREM